MDGVERLFLALWPDPATRAALDAWRQAWPWNAKSNPVQPESLHVTLHFFGDVERERQHALRALLPPTFERFSLRFSQATLWEHGIAVLEPESVPPALQALHAATGRVAAQLGLPPDQFPVYRPHVTLGRRAANTSVPQGVPPVSWQVDRYALVASRPEGYVVLHGWSAL
ncbi:RNA 2',3'-cyclic phosphodiesterase [Massilia sp. TS11]|uniref:RNA 2',3'-cyclic phosphodiesterase n=1 Tax=Massilia sp. TS11 TaxID=2908003 RepID=UPI001EDA40C5|nr:RNA 2',3'-cyclic phosphodiesterase [Massilia sp. TS11]MCG2586240.1 RNA 2',3'-cyclic phosphodiesterase [Massilia sp. TS11]